MTKIRSFVIGAALALIACVSISLMGQTTTGLMPTPRMQFLDSSGHPLNGGLVYTYAAGTTTPLASYTDSGGGTPNANPVVLDSAGRAGIWLSSAAYKITLKTSAGVQVWSVDNVTAPTLSTASITIPNAATFTMAAGSTSAFSAHLLPGAAATYDVGAGGNYWRAGYFNTIGMAGNLVIAPNNTYDIGTLSAAWRVIYGLTAQAHAEKLCGTTANVLLTGCYSLTATTDGTNTNAYTAVKDDGGTEIWRWSRREAGVDTGIATTGLHILPAADVSQVLGAVGKRWLGIVTKDLTVYGGDITYSHTGSHLNVQANDDTAGAITVTAATSATHGFSVGYSNAPTCVLTPTSDPGATTYWVTTTTVSFVAHLSGADTITFKYVCMGMGS